VKDPAKPVWRASYCAVEADRLCCQASLGRPDQVGLGPDNIAVAHDGALAPGKGFEGRGEWRVAGPDPGVRPPAVDDQRLAGLGGWVWPTVM